MQVSKIRGSTILTEKESKKYQVIAGITEWVVVSPLELKMHILAQNDPKAIQDNKCNICIDSLFSPFDDLPLQKVADIQADLLNDKIRNDLMTVVKLGNCDYFHAFHADCVSSHFTATSEGNKFYKCPICMKIYGVRVGAMPKGTMTW